MARLRYWEKWVPIPIREKFIVHCASGAAEPISDSMRSRSAGRLSPSGLLAIRSVVRLHPARAAQGLGINGHDLTATDAEVVAEIVALADGRVSEDALADWIRRHSTKRR